MDLAHLTLIAATSSDWRMTVAIIGLPIVLTALFALRPVENRREKNLLQHRTILQQIEQKAIASFRDPADRYSSLEDQPIFSGDDYASIIHRVIVEQAAIKGLWDEAHGYSKLAEPRLGPYFQSGLYCSVMERSGEIIRARLTAESNRVRPVLVAAMVEELKRKQAKRLP